MSLKKAEDIAIAIAIFAVASTAVMAVSGLLFFMAVHFFTEALNYLGR